MDLKYLIITLVAQKDAVIGLIGVVSYYLQSLLSAFELTVLCAYICRVGNFDTQHDETLVYKYAIRLTLPLLKTCNYN